MVQIATILGSPSESAVWVSAQLVFKESGFKISVSSEAGILAGFNLPELKVSQMKCIALEIYIPKAYRCCAQVLCKTYHVHS